MMQRLIIEMGSGNDLHGMDYQKAAERAIVDAMRHSTLPVFDSIGLPHSEMEVRVTIGVAEPEKIDESALAALLPRGRADVRATRGGQTVKVPGGDTIVIATAAIEAFLPSQSAYWQKSD